MLTPALAAAPPPARAWSGRSWRANVLACLRYAPYAAPWNIAGLPALVVPVGVRPDGLPVGVQLVGPPGSERLLLAVAGPVRAGRALAPARPGLPEGLQPRLTGAAAPIEGARRASLPHL